MKEKVSRPDKTGAWRNGSIVDDCDGDYSEQYPYCAGTSMTVMGAMLLASHTANQAIEKMIASAREKD